MIRTHPDIYFCVSTDLLVYRRRWNIKAFLTLRHRDCDRNNTHNHTTVCCFGYELLNMSLNVTSQQIPFLWACLTFYLKFNNWEYFIRSIWFLNDINKLPTLSDFHISIWTKTQQSRKDETAWKFSLHYCSS